MKKLILLFAAALTIFSCQKEEVVDTVSFEELEVSETSKSNTKLNIVIAGNNWGDFDVTNVVNTDYGSIVTLQNGKKVWSLTYNSDTQRAILDFHNRETVAGDIIPNADRTEGFSFYDDNNGPLDNSLIVITIVNSSLTSKGATLPSLSRITFNGLGHYNNTINMEFEDLEYYNSSPTGSEVVFSASDPYAGTFWITIKMNETGVPYGYVLNNTNGSNDYISGGNLEVIAAPGQVRLIGRAKKGISGTQYWTQTMTFVMYQ